MVEKPLQECMNIFKKKLLIKYYIIQTNLLNMVNLATKYLGLDLKNPLIVGSSGLTNSVEDIVDLEKKGAAAVVLKSIFEEEILLEYESVMKEIAADDNNLEYYDYFDYKIKDDNIKAYIKLIEDAKKAVKIPVIASINCTSAHEWTFFTKKMQEAGADAIELNAFILPTVLNRTAEQNEKIYFDLVEAVKKEITIPISLKISYYFSNLASTIKKLSETGIAGVVLFNRFYSPDFDIDTQQVVSSHVLSSEKDLPISLRWVSIMANRINCDIAASTGVHDGKSLIKQLLAGADAVQTVSALYKNGTGHIQS
ncbi:MAG: diguanylate cyclase [Bacteroidetes bacterium 4572_117]|nr:MAG: diguanylate cyclase [Bacteroidetes bacterium 4572_117]